MLKKLIIISLFFLLFTPSTFAKAEADFSKMNPTVKVVSYKKLFINQALSYGSGSGTVITPDGVLITNHHVIFDENEFKPLDTFGICITFDVKEEPLCQYTARLIAKDKDMDIALLKINGKDVYGNELPSLKTLSYKSTATPKEQTEINVAGYPGSGGETITITKGQISGFEEFNDYSYFKTDTDFDHGSSGGTALDGEGNFIGIPTYIRSYAENVGFFLDLREAKSWIEENIDKTPTGDMEAERYLKKDLARFEKANDELRYTQDFYPYAEVTLPAGWEFLEINEDSFFASQKNLSEPVGFSVFTSDYQFEVDDGYMDKLDEELERVKDSYPDYKKEEVTFGGEKAWLISYTSYSNKNYTYYIPYGYTMVGFSYSINLDESEKQEKAIKPVLDSFKFTGIPLDEPSLDKTISFDEPPFEISVAGDFRIMKNKDRYSHTLLAEAVQKDNFEGSFAIYYDQISKDERKLTAKERLDDIVKNLYSRKLVYKNDAVILGGLEGFLYTIEYEGSKFQEKRKSLEMVLKDGDFEFTIEYDDLTDVFDKNLPTIKTMLDSFHFKGKTETQATLHDYGNLGFTFNDILYHRFAQAISDLADKEIVKGYEDGGFHPEQLVSRVEALKMILESKNHLENEKESKDVIDFSKYENARSSFSDVATSHPLKKYVEYAKEKKVAEGYSKLKFGPGNNVNLVEALKMIINVYEIPVWSGDTDPWYKKYMDKGYEEGLIPRGLDDPGHLLTRAELAYLVSTVYKQAKN